MLFYIWMALSLLAVFFNIGFELYMLIILPAMGIASVIILDLYEDIEFYVKKIFKNQSSSDLVTENVSKT